MTEDGDQEGEVSEFSTVDDGFGLCWVRQASRFRQNFSVVFLVVIITAFETLSNACPGLPLGEIFDWGGRRLAVPIRHPLSPGRLSLD
jgi:hypothetical protein